MTDLHFRVTIPKAYCHMMAFVWLLSLCIPMVMSVAQGKVFLAGFIVLGIISLPFLFSAVWMKLFQIDVNGEEITVRRGIGTRYRFQLSDIITVKCMIRSTGMGTSKAYQIRLKRHKLSISNMMQNFEKIDVYLQTRIPPEKIVLKEKAAPQLPR